MTGKQHPHEGDQPQEGPVPPHATLAALAAQVADIRGKVTHLDALVDRAGLLAAGDIRRRVARLTADLDTLAGQVEAQGATLAGALAAGPRAKAPTWAGLSPEEHDAQLAELTEWVDGVLRPGYPDSAPAACWPSHWQAVWELSTLAAEWRRIYQRPAPELAGALDFHDRWLPGVTRRLAAIQADCTTSRCMAADPAQNRLSARLAAAPGGGLAAYGPAPPPARAPQDPFPDPGKHLEAPPLPAEPLPALGQEARAGGTCPGPARGPHPPTGPRA